MHFSNKILQQLKAPAESLVLTGMYNHPDNVIALIFFIHIFKQLKCFDNINAILLHEWPAGT